MNGIKRWSAKRKQEVVLRLLKGESLEKSVTVLTDDGHRYNVAPGLLTPEDDTRR